MRVAVRVEVGGLLVGRHLRERVGVRDAVRDELGAGVPRCVGHLWRLVIDHRVEQHGRRDADSLEHLEQPEGADPVAVLAPGGVDVVGLGHPGEEVLGVPGALAVGLDADRDVDGQAGSGRPAPGRAARVRPRDHQIVTDRLSCRSTVAPRRTTAW